MKIVQVDKQIYRGENPQGFDDLVRLRDLGIERWLHIENGFQRLFRWAFGAQDWQVRLGREYLFMPFSNISFPQQYVLEWCARKIESSMGNARGGIYVCCKHGKDRTGIVFAYWRVTRCGWTPARAWAEAQEHGMHKFYLWLGWEQKFLNMLKNKAGK